MIFNKARNEKRTGGKSDSPPKEEDSYKHRSTLGKPHSVSCGVFSCLFVELEQVYLVNIEVAMSQYANWLFYERDDFAEEMVLLHAVCLSRIVSSFG